MHEDRNAYRKALEDFHRLRSKAALDRFWAGIRGESLDLLAYDEVSSKLRAVSQTNLGLQQVALKNIIGSVNRTSDFDRNFRPLSDGDSTRWADVKAAMTSPFAAGVPPVTLYKIGEAYFVMDGNHRISIAKEMGLDSVEAYVTEVKTKVSLSSSFTLEELAEKAALADFLEDTHLDRILPSVELSLNRIEYYPLLKEHIVVHQYYMGIDHKREVSFDEAAVDWYDHVYSPVVRIIEESGLRYEFPELTITDLYLWVLDKQQALLDKYGTSFKTENVIDFVAKQKGKQTKTVVTTADREMDMHVSGMAEGSSDCLFRDILVGVSHSDINLLALQQAMMINRCKDGNIIGLHVKAETDFATEQTEAELETSFYQQLNEREMSGRFIKMTGNISKTLQEYGLLSDITVVKLSYPPGGAVFDRLGSGVITLLQSSRRPIMFVKEVVAPVNRILLMLDEDEKSREAFYIAVYYAARYGCGLFITMPEKDSKSSQDAFSFAKSYLDAIDLEFQSITLSSTSLVENLVSLIEENSISTVMMGGYRSTGLLGRLFSSNVDRVLELSPVPVLVFQ
ncbi:MAG: universal stress protein [Chloroflexi bacterium]|nr:universal stress protein [Chloroflexota bacterium]